MKELVSVIIPVYQAKKHLIGCLKSILEQTYKSVEIILVDDGSNDGSQTICDIYAEKYSNIYCIHQKNKGVSSARNVGIEQARGEYILFVDSDDYIAADYLEKAVEALRDQKTDLYLCGYQNVRKGGKIKEAKKYPSIKSGSWTREDISGVALKLFKSNILHAIGTKVYRREMILKKNIRFSENRKYYEDIHFCLSYLYFCKKIFIENEILYFYQRDIENSLSKQFANIDLESIYYTYVLLAKLIRIKYLNQEEKKDFYRLYCDIVDRSIAMVICAEGQYSDRIRKMYRQLAKDKIYNNAVNYKCNSNHGESFLIKCHLYFMAYIYRQIKSQVYMRYEK